MASGLEETIKSKCDAISDRSSAIAAIVQIQTALVASLEKKFPASNFNTHLNKGMSEAAQ